MLKHLITPIAIIFLLITACKKESPTPVTPVIITKNLVFKASSSTPMSVTLMIVRPTGLTTGVVGSEIESDAVANITTPYEYKSSKIQAGDNVQVLIQNPPDQTLTGTLTINGVTIPYTSLTAGTALTIINWNFIVK